MIHIGYRIEVLLSDFGALWASMMDFCEYLLIFDVYQSSFLCLLP